MAAIERDQDDLSILRMLLDRDDVEVNQVDAFGQTALHYASRNCSLLPAARLLLSRNKSLNINIQDSLGSTALLLAATNLCAGEHFFCQLPCSITLSMRRCTQIL